MLLKAIKNCYLLRPLLFILLLAIPLYPKFPLYGVEQTYVAIRLEDFIVAFTVLILVIHQIKNGFPLLKLSITKLFIAYFVAILASTITSILIFQTDPANILFLNFFRRLEYMSLFFITITALSTKSDLKFSSFFLILGTIGVSLYGYGQKYFQFPVVSTMNEEFSKGQLLSLSTWTRINSTFAGHYDLAVFMSISLIIIGCIAVLTKKIYLKIPLILIWLISFQILNFTASRISTFAFWGGMVLALILIRRYLWVIPISALVIFSIINSKDLNQRLLATLNTIRPITQQNIPTIAPLPTVIPIIPTSIPVIAQKITPSAPAPTIIRHALPYTYPSVDVDAGVSRSGEIRFNVEWPRAINAFKKNPLVGTGLGSITLATDNDYLRSLGESGLIGFSAFSIIFIWFFRHSFLLIFKKKQTDMEKYSLVLLSGLVAMLANAIFIDAFEASKTAYLFWIMMGTFYCLLREINHQKLC